MKDLNRYIKESLLDDEDDLIGDNDFLIAQKLKEVIFDKIWAVKDVTYSNGVISITTNSNPLELGGQYDIKSIAPETHTLNCSDPIRIYLTNLDSDQFCDNIRCNGLSFDGPAVRDVNLDVRGACIFYTSRIENSTINVEDGLIRFYRMWPEFNNVTSNAEEVYIYTNDIFKPNSPAIKILNNIIDRKTSLEYWDEKEGDYVVKPIKKITDLITKVQNQRRYSKFSDSIDFKNFDIAKELGLDKFKQLNKITLCNQKAAVQFLKYKPTSLDEIIVGHIGDWWVKILAY